MAVRRRSRKRPLTEFAQRSPLHAVAAGIIRFALLAGVAIVAYLVTINVLVSRMIGGLVEQFRTRNT